MTDYVSPDSKNLKVSIALCTYNGDRFLQEQLDSIANQTRFPEEVVIGDDGSTDKTLEILERWRDSVPFRVKLSLGRRIWDFSKTLR
ncbi:MAG: glycosyltransferase [Planctomycetia bacterium]|nr:glycosyltransferase [Planctomycetia bacterium]